MTAALIAGSVFSKNAGPRRRNRGLWEIGTPAWATTAVLSSGWNTFDLAKAKILVDVGDEYVIGRFPQRELEAPLEYSLPRHYPDAITPSAISNPIPRRHRERLPVRCVREPALERR